jgi:probable rRNA maturation factor
MIGVETIIEYEDWRRDLPDPEEFVARVFAAARAREPRLEGSAALLFADDAALRDLNSRFRGKDTPTNVLSFPSGEAAPGFLGDIAIAFETAARESAERRTAFADHVAHLVAHGLLHLVGHDHIDDADAARMERLETEILDALGVSNPYETEETIE